MRTAKAIILTDDERRTLKKWSRGRGAAARLVLRSQIVLAAAKGRENHEIAEELGCTRRTVGTWRNRFAVERLAGIEHDAPTRQTRKPPSSTSGSSRPLMNEVGDEQPQSFEHDKQNTEQLALPTHELQHLAKAPDTCHEIPDGLEASLNECRKAARRGYKIAKENLHESAEKINIVSMSMLQCLKAIKNGGVRTPGIVEQLKEQLSTVVNELLELQRHADSALEERHKRLDSFSITLFGRTMAGKSTLMEILTRGDGQSIGTGAQRTTREVRSYSWNGLEVTDVPGVAAFGGKADEELAIRSASQADLILFLITDDAPQSIEAEWLARVRRLGKPVLGICNVKVAVDDEEDLILFLRKPDRSFNHTRLNQLINQFHALADQHLPGKPVPFTVTHLRSRFLAEQPTFGEYRDRLKTASRFDEIESQIVKEVVGFGTFLRAKSFIDMAVVPLKDLTDLLLKFSLQTSNFGRVLTDKRCHFHDWSQEFRSHAQDRFNSLALKTMNALRDDVASFAEDHFEDSTAGESWNRHVESTGVDRKAQEVRNELFNECKKSINEVTRKLQSQLSLVIRPAGAPQIAMQSIFDEKRAWDWGIVILTGGLGIAAVVLGSSPLYWAAASVGVVGELISESFDSREKKARRARKKLAKRLYEDIDERERNLRGSLGDWFQHELFDKQVYLLLANLGTISDALFQLADAQRTLAWSLNDLQKTLARTLAEEALDHLKAGDLKQYLTDVARVPGLGAMFLVDSNTPFPSHVREDIEGLLGEKIWFVVDTKSRNSNLTLAIGQEFEWNKIRIEERIRVAHVPIDDLGAEAKARVPLAQQLTGLHVMP